MVLIRILPELYVPIPLSYRDQRGLNFFPSPKKADFSDIFHVCDKSFEKSGISPHRSILCRLDIHVGSIFFLKFGNFVVISLLEIRNFLLTDIDGI
jgi:hypothetical protein